ncbi:MAG: hypothetical protein F6J92_33610 [Symploca sp. SIO1A3]|nr:hypothetical protein [Symploca sp. SIO1A3]
MFVICPWLFVLRILIDNRTAGKVSLCDRYSLFPIAYSLLPITYSLLPIPYPQNQ